MHRGFLKWAAFSGALAVALGAFGAHTLKDMVSPASLIAFETGVRYQFYHTLALFFVAILYKRFPGKWSRYAGISFLLGILLFSGSLYLITASQTSQTIGSSRWGLITPLGGLLLVSGWLFLLMAVSKNRRPTES